MKDFASVRRDFFDSSEGAQAGINSEGTPVLVLTFTPSGYKMVLDGWHHFADHGCVIGQQVALYLLAKAAEELQAILGDMPQEIQDFKPFGH